MPHAHVHAGTRTTHTHSHTEAQLLDLTDASRWIPALNELVRMAD